MSEKKPVVKYLATNECACAGGDGVHDHHADCDGYPECTPHLLIPLDEVPEGCEPRVAHWDRELQTIMPAISVRWVPVEPEHREWCALNFADDTPPFGCSCERRKGERRVADRRDMGHVVIDMTGGRRALYGSYPELRRGRRTGTDRRAG